MSLPTRAEVLDELATMGLESVSSTGLAGLYFVVCAEEDRETRERAEEARDGCQTCGHGFVRPRMTHCEANRNGGMSMAHAESIAGTEEEPEMVLCEDRRCKSCHGRELAPASRVLTDEIVEAALEEFLGRRSASTLSTAMRCALLRSGAFVEGEQ